MKKFVVLLLVILTAGIASAADYKSNVYQTSVWVHEGARTATVTLPVPSRSITIINGDTDGVYVNINSASAPSVIGAGATGFLLVGKQAVTFDNFVTEGVGFNFWTAEASPISVISTY